MYKHMSITITAFLICWWNGLEVFIKYEKILSLIKGLKMEQFQIVSKLLFAGEQLVPMCILGILHTYHLAN